MVPSLPTSHVFYILYSEKTDPAPQRPITFVFNDGPGAASVYLHLGAFGPHIPQTAPDGSFLPTPQNLIDNPDSWLDMTDLVFCPRQCVISGQAVSPHPSQYKAVELATTPVSLPRPDL
jgi:Serine carboxypeptidase